MQELSVPAPRHAVDEVKMVLMQRGLNDTYTGGMGSFLLSCVVIFFFQKFAYVRRRQAAQELATGSSSLRILRNLSFLQCRCVDADQQIAIV